MKYIRISGFLSVALLIVTSCNSTRPGNEKGAVAVWSIEKAQECGAAQPWHRV